METTGQLRDVTRDVTTGKLIVSFIIDKQTAELPDGLLDITIDKHREKRSLSANAFFHVIVTKIAGVLKVSNSEVKNRLIREYGEYLYVDGRIPTMTMKAEYEASALCMDGIHLKPVEYYGDTVKMALMRGSHTYDSKEMSRLIDGAVEEAKELGIETLTPVEIERIKQAWKRAE